MNKLSILNQPKVKNSYIC